MRPLLKLLASNRKVGSFRAEAATDSATIYVYDMIVSSDAEAEFFGGVSPEQFVKTLKGITAPVIHVRINSPGGDVFAARAMEAALRQHDAKIIVHIDGYAASAASFLAMAGDEIEIGAGAFLMIHKAWTMAFGNCDDLISTAALLEKIDATLVETYAARTKQKPDQVASWLAEETWFTGQEAVDKGFADRLAAAEAKNATAWDISAYAHSPKMNSTTIEASTPAVTASATNFDDLRRRLQLITQAA